MAWSPEETRPEEGQGPGARKLLGRKYKVTNHKTTLRKQRPKGKQSTLVGYGKYAENFGTNLVSASVSLADMNGWASPPPPTPPPPVAPIRLPQFAKLGDHVTTGKELMLEGRYAEAVELAKWSARPIREIYSPPPPPPPPSPPPPSPPPPPPPIPPKWDTWKRQQDVTFHLRAALPHHMKQGSVARRHEGQINPPPAPDSRQFKDFAFGQIPLDVEHDHLMSEKQRKRLEKKLAKERLQRMRNSAHIKQHKERAEYSSKALLEMAAQEFAANSWPPAPPPPGPMTVRLHVG